MNLDLPSRITREVILPVRGTPVTVRALYAGEAIRLEQSLRASDSVAKTTAMLVAAYLSTPDGYDVYTPEQALDVLERTAPRDVRALIEAGQKLNSLEDEAIEAAAKN